MFVRLCVRLCVCDLLHKVHLIFLVATVDLSGSARNPLQSAVRPTVLG